MSRLYNEKCDRCGKEIPEFFVQVNKSITSSGGIGSQTQLWCLECISETSSEDNE